MAHPDRKGGGGLSLRTLMIASAASLTAAMVTRHFFPPGTIYASAFTPVIVAAVSEMLNRPADRMAEFRRQRRTLVIDAQRQRIAHGESTPLREEAVFAEEVELSGTDVTTAPLRVDYPRRRRRLREIHPRVWVATGLVAFGIAAAVLTLPELIFGGAVSSNSRTTFFGGGSSSSQTHTQQTTTPATTQTQTTTTVTQTVTTPTTTTTGTSTTPTTTDTTTAPAPSGGAPAPTATTPTTTTGP